jgi:hypothetical protein
VGAIGIRVAVLSTTYVTVCDFSAATCGGSDEQAYMYLQAMKLPFITLGYLSFLRMHLL